MIVARFGTNLLPTDECGLREFEPTNRIEAMMAEKVKLDEYDARQAERYRCLCAELERESPTAAVYCAVAGFVLAAAMWIHPPSGMGENPVSVMIAGLTFGAVGLAFWIHYRIAKEHISREVKSIEESFSTRGMYVNTDGTVYRSTR